jgi:flagellar biosynthesis/type III secretory pathway protein FliH
MPNGIYLTLEQYKDKDLPLTITVNGNTYHSQFALATAQTTYFEMGKQQGMELGSDNTYSDNEMSNMHDAWFDEGYTKGYEAGYDAGIDRGIEKTLQDDRVKEELERTKQTWYAEGKEAGYGDGYTDGKKEATLEKVDQFNKGYEIGKYDGYEAGKKANGYTVDDIKQLHTDNEFTRKLWYDKGKAEGYGDGYTDGNKQCKHDGISKINLNTESVEQTELSKEYDKGFTKGYAEGKAEGYSDGPEQTEYAKGYEEGKKDGITERPRTSFVDWLNSKKR